MKNILWIVLSLILLPALTLVLYKPFRVLLPSLAGVVCPTEHLCTDEPEGPQDAILSLRDALGDIARKLGKLSYRPTFIFCRSRECFEPLGFERASAKTVGTTATVIGPKGWADHYLKHGLIHQWQADLLGTFVRFSFPERLHEGMAYALSDDPRP